MSLKSFAITAALASAMAAAPAQAGLIFSDNFDADNAASVLNFNSLINWTVGDGTIDYIRSGNYSIDCFGGTGGCLDMDGSTSNAGRITSIATYTFLAGVSYTLEAQVSGNQRGGASDSVTFGFVDATTGAMAAMGTWSGIPWDSAFVPHTLTTFTSGPSDQVVGTYRLFIEGIGSDNVGVIVDNVVLRDDRAAVVPEPATLLLSSLALLAAGVARRRR